MNSLQSLTFIDLTHTLNPTVPNWNGNCGFKNNVVVNYADCKTKTKFCVQTFEMNAGIGTHMDAPAHCFSDGKTISDIPLGQLINPCVVINIADKCHESYQVSIDDILHFEKQYGKIEKHHFVIIRTGWDKYWSQPEKYRNNLKFPTVSSDVAELLLQREIVGLGIDTLSPDSDSGDFPVHDLVLGAGKYIVENIANAHLLPPTNSYVIALPLKIKDGTESPIRLIAGYQKEK